MQLTNPSTTILYSIEEAIKAYRKMSLKNIKTVISDITIDQALILQIIEEKDLTQTEIADLIFKDYASMTRIVNLLVKKKYVVKKINEKDRRVAVLNITKKGKEAINQLTPTIKENRENAMNGISNNELNNLHKTLKKIIKNCDI
ncbi:MarR family transcriptional regulator [uncultured Tenacibaculum sp.]|uniref:MarR family winged helix-turn-helix transcriptional regulator n=1 Tax=uncultured Tenacibaculum sp. TaxID=174713 RepID=UPI0026129ECD|nr:MarR family transcriptional regulator [uncultured Tenacibaculum sp.]